MTQIVNIKDTQYIGRAGKGQDGYFGNPYLIHAGRSREEALHLYSVYFYARIRSDPEFKRKIEELRGKTLICFCKPLPCHGDIIVEYLNNIDRPTGYFTLEDLASIL